MNHPNFEVIVVENIGSYIVQVDYLILIDNSDKNNAFIIDELNNKNIKYIFNGSNIGVAAALNLGAEEAIQQGYKFLLNDGPE